MPSACKVENGKGEKAAESSVATAGELDYRKLASPALYAHYVGKTVTTRALFLSEWRDLTVYKAVGVNTANHLFLNHRAPDYMTIANGLGSSDMEFPPFVMSADVALADQILQLKRGDLISVTGKIVAIERSNEAALFEMEISEIKRAR